MSLCKMNIFVMLPMELLVKIYLTNNKINVSSIIITKFNNFIWKNINE